MEEGDFEFDFKGEMHWDSRLAASAGTMNLRGSWRHMKRVGGGREKSRNNINTIYM